MTEENKDTCATDSKSSCACACSGGGWIKVILFLGIIAAAIAVMHKGSTKKDTVSKCEMGGNAKGSCKMGCTAKGACKMGAAVVGKVTKTPTKMGANCTMMGALATDKTAADAPAKTDPTKLSPETKKATTVTE